MEKVLTSTYSTDFAFITVEGFLLVAFVVEEVALQAAILCK